MSFSQRELKKNIKSTAEDIRLLARRYRGTCSVERCSFEDWQGKLLHHSTMSDLYSVLASVEPGFEGHELAAYTGSGV
jgi:hypothetical protein